MGVDQQAPVVRFELEGHPDTLESLTYEFPGLDLSGWKFPGVVLYVDEQYEVIDVGAQLRHSFTGFFGVSLFAFRGRSCFVAVERAEMQTNFL